MPDPRLTRRQFLATTVAAAVAASCGGDDDAAPVDPTATPTGAATQADPTATPTAAAPTATPTATPEPELQPPPAELISDPFTLGVASGDPTAESVILWTRLVIDPLDAASMGPDDHEVLWEVATDDTFDEIVDAGIAPALAALGHSVHVDAGGLTPDTWYAYRFRVGDFTSPVGRTRTFPGPGASPPVRFGVSSCQNWETGFYGAHRHAAAEELDVFVWLGDYIYEGGPGQLALTSPDAEIRVHNSPEVETLDAYRNRYGLYRSDPDLQANHAMCPWLITWDDHEVDNDYAGAVSENDDPTDAFLERRAVAYQAWYEHMPVRLDPPDGPDYEIYRDAVWGDLVRFFVLDGRQFRDDQPRDGEFVPLPGLTDEDLPVRTLSPTALDPEHRFFGEAQERWLLDGVASSTQRWNVLAQQVIMHGLSILPGQEPPLIVTDVWDGYYANREVLLESLAASGAENVVVLTGDFHAATVGDVKPDPFDPESPVVATELMAPAISSSFPPQARDLAPLVLGFNPQIKFFDPDNGYLVCEADDTELRATYRTVTDPTDPATAVATAATFVVSTGSPGAKPV